MSESQSNDHVSDKAILDEHTTNEAMNIAANALGVPFDRTED